MSTLGDIPYSEYNYFKLPKLDVGTTQQLGPTVTSASNVGGLDGQYISPDALIAMGFNPDMKMTPSQLEDLSKSGFDFSSTVNSGLGSSIFGSKGFGMNQGTLQGLGSISNILGGLGGIYLGSKQLGLAKDKFAYDKDMMNKQYAMAKDSYDKQVARANSIDKQMNAGKVE